MLKDMIIIKFIKLLLHTLRFVVFKKQCFAVKCIVIRIFVNMPDKPVLINTLCNCCIAIIFFNCVGYKASVQYEIEDGMYKYTHAGERTKVWLDNEEEFIYLFVPEKTDFGYQLDELATPVATFPQISAKTPIERQVFSSSGFDLDVITIPFKYRFRVNEFPHQLNTNPNASLYFGFRTDYYRLMYLPNAISQYKRTTRHYGLTAGFFSGFGATAVNPYVTDNAIGLEYDGVVWSNGIAVSLGIDYLNLGIALGWDRLLDRNRVFWIYQQKPYVGLVLGINLN
jgi:hypothetical protein